MPVRRGSRSNDRGGGARSRRMVHRARAAACRMAERQIAGRGAPRRVRIRACASRCGPFFAAGGGGFPGTNVAETELVVSREARVLIAVAGRERLSCRSTGDLVLAGDPVLIRSASWLVAELPAGSRLRLTVLPTPRPGWRSSHRAATQTMRWSSGADRLGAGLRTRELPAGSGRLRWGGGDTGSFGFRGDARRAGIRGGDLVARWGGSLARARRWGARWRMSSERRPAAGRGRARLQAMQDDHASAGRRHVASLIRSGCCTRVGAGTRRRGAGGERARLPDDPGPALVDARLAIGRKLERARVGVAENAAAGRSCRRSTGRSWRALGATPPARWLRGSRRVGASLPWPVWRTASSVRVVWRRPRRRRRAGRRASAIRSLARDGER